MEIGLNDKCQSKCQNLGRQSWHIFQNIELYELTAKRLYYVDDRTTKHKTQCQQRDALNKMTAQFI